MTSTNIKGDTWFNILMNSGSIETLDMFENRINSYIWNSIPKQGELWTAKGLEAKVYPDFWGRAGKLKDFFGNTIVYSLDERAISYIKEIQERLTTECQDILAEPLKSDTFHMTLHDLVNGPEYFESELCGMMNQTGFVALSVLNELKKIDIPKIRMESTCVFNMASTSVVLGLKPADEESMKVLMTLHQLFQSVVHLDYPLTPHITLAYFRPGIHSAEKLMPLRRIIEDVKGKEKLTLELDIAQLNYMEFYSMNDYLIKDFRREE